MHTREEYKRRRQAIGTRKFVAALIGGEKPQKLANYEQGKQKIPPIAWWALNELEGKVIKVCKCEGEKKLVYDPQEWWRSQYQQRMTPDPEGWHKGREKKDNTQN